MTNENKEIERLRLEIARNENELASMKQITSGMDKERALRHGAAVTDLEFKLQDAKLHLNTLLDASRESRQEELRGTRQMLSDLTREMEQARIQMEAG